MSMLEDSDFGTKPTKAILGPNQARFLDALEKSTDLQTKGTLRDVFDPSGGISYCALGIGVKDFSEAEGILWFVAEADFLNHVALENLGQPHSDVDVHPSIVTMNDNMGMSFKEIAEYLRENGDYYFSSPK